MTVSKRTLSAQAARQPQHRDRPQLLPRAHRTQRPPGPAGLRRGL